MIRKNKQPKMIRRKKAGGPPHKEFPGYMPNPPLECHKYCEFTGKKGVYINNMVCANCKNQCQRKKHFEREWREYNSNHKT
jgi:hypothetical protein